MWFEVKFLVFKIHFEADWFHHDGLPELVLVVVLAGPEHLNNLRISTSDQLPSSTHSLTFMINLEANVEEILASLFHFVHTDKTMMKLTLSQLPRKILSRVPAIRDTA